MLNRSANGIQYSRLRLMIFSVSWPAAPEANAGWDVRASSGTTNPIDDYAATIQAQSVDTSDFKATGTLYWPSGDQPKFQQVGQTDWKD